MSSRHFLSKLDGAVRLDGLRGVVMGEGSLDYLVRWEDGSSSRHEQGDNAVTWFEFTETSDSWGVVSVSADPLYREIHDAWALWNKAGPPPNLPPQNVVIPIAADTEGYGYPHV